MQCLSTLRSFSRVLWPEVFTDFIVAIDQFTVEAFSIVPAECVVGRRLGFYYELVATLLLPIFSFVVIMTMALLLYGYELQQARRASRKQREAQARAELESASFAQVLSRESGASSGWLPAEQPMQWLECAVLEPSLEGKWERGRWQGWLESQESSLLR